MPLATDPRSSVNVTALVGSGISSGAVPSISTIATYPDSFIALIPDRWTIDEFEILSVG